jgi:hypothetical protein
MEVQKAMGIELTWSWTKPELVGAVCLWLTTERADFLRGRWLSANWRVDDLDMQRDCIASKHMLKTAFNLKLGRPNQGLKLDKNVQAK